MKPQSKINISVTITNVKNPTIVTSSNLMIPTEELFTAVEVKEFVEKILTDSLAYYSDNGEWPELDIITDEDEIEGDKITDAF